MSRQLAHAPHVHEVLAQQVFVLAVAELVVLAVTALGVFQPFPELERAAEFALLVVELGVRLGGLGLLVQRAVAHVLYGKRRGDHHHLVERAALLRLQDHAAHARVQRQPRERLADRGEFVVVVNRAELGEQLVTIDDGALLRRLDEGELFHRAQAQRLHAQDHASQRTAQDFGVGELRAAVEAGLVVQADTDAIGHAAAAPGALVRRGLADRLHHELLHLLAEAVALHPRGAHVDHVADARHRERGLGHVGREHDAPPAVLLEDAVLLGLREPREQRQHLRVAQRGNVAQMLAQVVGGFADLAFTGQEHQDVASQRPTPKLIHRVGDRAVQVVVAALFKRAPAHLHRKGATRHHDHRRRTAFRGEVLRKTVGIDRGRGHHHLEVRPARQQLAQVAQQKVDVEAALVRLVNDDGVVGAQVGVGLRFGEQDAVGHELDGRVFRQPILETHLEADHVTQGRLQLLGNALGHAGRGNAPRLRVADHLAALAGFRIALAAPHRQRDFRDLRCLAGAGFSADDDHLVLAHGRFDLEAARRNRQGFREFDEQGLGRPGGRRGIDSVVHGGIIAGHRFTCSTCFRVARPGV